MNQKFKNNTLGLFWRGDFPFLFWSCTQMQPDSYNADVIVTAAPCIFLLLKLHNRKSVIVVSQIFIWADDWRIGYTDTGRKEVIGGLARFYHRLYNHYQQEIHEMDEKKNLEAPDGVPAIDGLCVPCGFLNRTP